jgi:hypothetical protein
MRDADPGSASSTASSGSGSGCHSGCTLRAEDALRRQRVAACLAMLSAPASPTTPRPSIRSAARIYNLPKSTVHRLLQQTRGASPTKRRRARPAFAAAPAVAKVRPCHSTQQRPPKKSALDFILSPEPATPRRQTTGSRSIDQNVLPPPRSFEHLTPIHTVHQSTPHVDWEGIHNVQAATAPLLEPYPEQVSSRRFASQDYYSYSASKSDPRALLHDDEVLSTSVSDHRTSGRGSGAITPQITGSRIPSQYSSFNISKVTGFGHSDAGSPSQEGQQDEGQAIPGKGRLSSVVRAEETSPAPRAPSHVLDPAWTLMSLMERTTPRCKA